MSSATTELLSALQTWFAANLATPFTGGLSIHEIPARTAFPYAVATLIASPATQKYGGAGVAYSENVVQFSVFGVPPAANALAAMDALIAALDNVTLSLANGRQHFHSIRLGEPVPTPDSPGQDEQGRDVFVWTVTYQFAVR